MTKGEKLAEIRKSLRQRNGEIYREKFRDYFKAENDRIVSVMRKRHAYYTQLIRESGVKTVKEFYDKFMNHFEMYGVKLSLSDDEAGCLIHLELGDYDYEDYSVLRDEDSGMVIVSPIVEYKNLFCNDEINIFQENTL